MKYTRLSIVAILYSAFVLGTLLVACADKPSIDIAPAGAPKGQNTFLLFYTDK